MGIKGRRKHRNKNQPQKEDIISNLPEDLLLNILERVDTADAIRTCILSKQMLNLPNMFSIIDIDFWSILGDDKIDNTRHLIDINGVVADLTSKILSTRCPQITLEKLKLRFFLRDYDCLFIGTAIADAMATQKLNAIEFEILTMKDSDQFTEAEQINYAKQFNIFRRRCPDAFGGLTRLHLQNLRFGESDIPKMLASCKKLEYLLLHECDEGVGSVLQIKHERLVELEIVLGDYKKVELLHLPQLRRITCDEWNSQENPLVFGFVPLLSKLSLISPGLIHPSIRLSELLASVNFISDLHLNFQSKKIWVVPESPQLLVPLFCKLRCVNLDKIPEGCDINWTIFILKAAPFLEELSITLWDHWCQEIPGHNDLQPDYLKWDPAASIFKHKYLSKISIHGFESNDKFIGYIRRVAQAATNLKEISLHDRKTCEPCIDEFGPETMTSPSRYPQTEEERDLVRQKVTELPGMSSSAVIFFRS